MQKTEEWFEKRKLRITGSRVGAILGVNPWMKPSEVLRSMVREYHGYPDEFYGDIPPIQHGINNERRAQLAFMRESGLGVDDCGFFEFGDRMGASPDGLTSDGGVLEIKVPDGLRNDTNAEFKPLKDQQHYYHQVMMEMLAADKKHAYFAQYVAPKGDPLAHDYVPEQINIERIEFDEKWLDGVLPKINEFYAQLLNELGNKEHLEPLRVVIDTPDAGSLVSEIETLRERQKEDSAREKELLAELVKLADEKDAEIHGRKLTKVVRAGSVSWKKVAKELMPDGFDLKLYTGKGSEHWRLT